jgi:hypothetical protein
MINPTKDIIMPLRLSCDSDTSWNSNVFTIIDGVESVTVCVHRENDDPDCGETVSISRHEFLALCETYARVTPPIDHP